MGGEVLVADVELVQPPHQPGDAGMLGMAVEAVAKRVALILEGEAPLGKPGGYIADRLVQRDLERPLAHLRHQRLLLPKCNELALADHANAVGHLLGFLDIMGGEDDGRAAGAELAHQLPHVAA